MVAANCPKCGATLYERYCATCRIDMSGNPPAISHERKIRIRPVDPAMVGDTQVFALGEGVDRIAVISYPEYTPSSEAQAGVEAVQSALDGAATVIALPHGWTFEVFTIDK